jgi:hypothetical protein
MKAFMYDVSVRVFHYAILFFFASSSCWAYDYVLNKLLLGPGLGGGKSRPWVETAGEPATVAGRFVWEGV